MRLGLPESAAKMLYLTLTEMRHRVQTDFGVLADFITSVKALPLFGTGQGSGASPIIWLTTCEVCLRVLDKLGFDVIFYSPDGKFEVKRQADAFVDDTYLTVLTDYVDPAEAEADLIQKLKHNGKVWEQSLWSSGGALALHKCAWHLLVGKWTGSKFKWLNNKQTSADLTLTCGDEGEETIIRQKNPSEFLKQLGVQAAPTGCMKEQVKVLKYKADLWSKQVHPSFLTATEVFISYNVGIQKSISYVLPVTRLTPQDCSRIDQPIV